MDKLITPELRAYILDKNETGGLNVQAVTKKLSTEARNEIACYGVAQVLCDACMEGELSVKNGYFKKAKAKRTFMSEGGCSKEDNTKSPRRDDTLHKNRPVKKILMLGLDNAGKTSVINKLKRCTEMIKPTQGFIKTSMENHDVVLHIWEFGGNESVRSHWSQFFEDTSLLIYVLDAADEIKLPLATYVFQNVIADERLSSVPVLILANKQDITTAKKTAEIEKILELRRFYADNHKFQILETSATLESNKYHSVSEIEDAIFYMATNDMA